MNGDMTRRDFARAALVTCAGAVAGLPLPVGGQAPEEEAPFRRLHFWSQAYIVHEFEYNEATDVRRIVHADLMSLGYFPESVEHTDKMVDPPGDILAACPLEKVPVTLRHDIGCGYVDPDDSGIIGWVHKDGLIQMRHVTMVEVADLRDLLNAPYLRKQWTSEDIYIGACSVAP